MHDAARELLHIGMTPREVERKAEAWTRADRALDGLGAGGERWSAWVPGRIEVFGKHTDYAGGRSLLCAVERGFVIRAAARTDPTVRALDVATGTAHTTRIGTRASGAPASGWGRYVETVGMRIADNFPDASRGVDLAFESDLPVAAGISSSSALVVAVFLMLAHANDLPATPSYQRAIRSRADLASYLGAVENGQSFATLAGTEGVGTFGGSEDHVAILCASPLHVMQYAFVPVRLEGAYRIPVERRFVVASSGVRAEKASGARDQYNRLSLMVRAILDRWNRATGRTDASLADAVDSNADAPTRLRAIVAHGKATDFDAADLLRRLDHFLLESTEIVPAAGAALATGDWRTFGALSTRSHRAAEGLLGNQVAETVALARSARELGAEAASSFGAGFGGSVWALVSGDGARSFAERWSARYAANFPDAANRAEFFVSQAGPGAHVW